MARPKRSVRDFSTERPSLTAVPLDAADAFIESSSAPELAPEETKAPPPKPEPRKTKRVKPPVPVARTTEETKKVTFECKFDTWYWLRAKALADRRPVYELINEVLEEHCERKGG